MAEQLVIGIDGGATKTHMAVANAAGEILSMQEAGGTYYVLDDALEHMIALLKPLSHHHLKTAVFTVAGWDFEADQQKQRALIERALAINDIRVENAIYENDIYATLKSAKGVTEPCVVISCGTGIMGLAAHQGRYYKMPGYEYLSGEWGSGIHQAEFAIHLACASLLGREEEYPILIQKALTYFEADDIDSLAYNIVNRFTTNRQRGYFLGPVYKAYDEGCAGAARVVHRAGLELARTVWCLLKKVEITRQANLIFGGGVIKNFGLPPNFQEELYRLTPQQFNYFQVHNPPVYGALYWALEEAGYPTNLVAEHLVCSPMNVVE
jgi:N-acetylglucosamine kinase-like BadF-type ATPase